MQVATQSVITQGDFARAHIDGGGADVEHSLALAILVDAIRCYRRCVTGRTARDWRDIELTYHWLRSPERAWPFAFASSCELFGLDTGRLRSKLVRGADQAA